MRRSAARNADGRVALTEYPRSFRGYQSMQHDDLTRKLHEHRRLLLVEAVKQRVLLPETLTDLLRQARTALERFNLDLPKELRVFTGPTVEGQNHV